MTFSIVGFDPGSGDLGVAVASKFLAVGSVVPWARASVGAIATQAWSNLDYGPDGLALLEGGALPPDVVRRLVAADPARDERQIGVVDVAGAAAAHTGTACVPWAGHRLAEGAAIQGNILTGPDVVDAMLESWTASGRPDRPSKPLADRLLAALVAGDRAGGDRRGRQSAALLVVRAGGGYGGRTDRWMDLRVDDHPDPVAELARIRERHRMYWDRPDATDLIPIDDGLAAELVHRLDSLAESTTQLVTGAADLAALAAGRPAIGSARMGPPAWTVDRERQLTGWMAIENLEERITASGWIDPFVLHHLRESTDGA